MSHCAQSQHAQHELTAVLVGQANVLLCRVIAGTKQAHSNAQSDPVMTHCTKSEAGARQGHSRQCCQYGQRVACSSGERDEAHVQRMLEAVCAADLEHKLSHNPCSSQAALYTITIRYRNWAATDCSLKLPWCCQKGHTYCFRHEAIPTNTQLYIQTYIHTDIPTDMHFLLGTDLMKLGSSLRLFRCLFSRNSVSSMSGLLGAFRKCCCHPSMIMSHICFLTVNGFLSPSFVSLLNILTSTLTTRAATTHFRMKGKTKQ